MDCAGVYHSRINPVNLSYSRLLLPAIRAAGGVTCWYASSWRWRQCAGTELAIPKPGGKFPVIGATATNNNLIDYWGSSIRNPLESTLRAYYRPGATAIERLESHIAYLLCSRPETSGRLAALLVEAAGLGPARESAVRRAFPDGCASHPGEALGMARALLFFCGVSLESERTLAGGPRQDFARLIRGGFPPVDLTAPGSYAAPSLVEGYCYMGASFARGMDRVFEGVTGQPLGEHMRRALAVLKTSP